MSRGLTCVCQNIATTIVGKAYLAGDLLSIPHTMTYLANILVNGSGMDPVALLAIRNIIEDEPNSHAQSVPTYENCWWMEAGCDVAGTVPALVETMVRYLELVLQRHARRWVAVYGETEWPPYREVRMHSDEVGSGPIVSVPVSELRVLREAIQKMLATVEDNRRVAGDSLERIHGEVERLGFKPYHNSV